MTESHSSFFYSPAPTLALPPTRHHKVDGRENTIERSHQALLEIFLVKHQEVMPESTMENCYKLTSPFGLEERLL